VIKYKKMHQISLVIEIYKLKTPFSFIHFDEFALMSLTKSEIAMFGLILTISIRVINSFSINHKKDCQSSDSD